MQRHLRFAAPDDLPEIELPEAAFAGRTTMRFITQALATDSVSVNVVDFKAGARSRPHSHDSDQLVIYLSGEGIVAVDGGADQAVGPGVFVLLPAGLPHMHGASEAGPARHISIMPTGHATDFDCPIPPAWKQWEHPDQSRLEVPRQTGGRSDSRR